MKRFLAHTLAAALVALAPGMATAGEVLVFAASSLKEAMEAVAAGWQETTGHTAVLSLAGSSTLARQIQAGAPADAFISASPDWVDALERDDAVRPGSRRDLLTNALVIVAHDAGAEAVDFADERGLALRLGDDRLAMALVDAVPAGIYGKAALQALGWWEALAPQVAQADNVRAALALVASGEAPFGIVYATDAAAEPRVTVVGTFPEGLHPPIIYPVIIPADSTSPLAGAFADYLAGPLAADIFRRYGFGLAEQVGK